MGFGSFEEALAYINQPTWHEKENKIFLVETRVVLDREDVKAVVIKKSDNTSTFWIIYQGSTRRERSWQFWCPSANQVLFLREIDMWIRDVEYDNNLRRQQ